MLNNKHYSQKEKKINQKSGQLILRWNIRNERVASENKIHFYIQEHPPSAI